jgi:hypothetical protein
MNPRDVPVYLTNWNNLDTGFKMMVEWFLNRDMKVTVFDNQSSYPPLLEYYKQMAQDIDVIHVGKNANTWVFWQEGFNTEERTKTHYITSDADCPPDPDCPDDVIEKMCAVLDELPTCKKVSPGIRLDNLPDCYARKTDAIACQAGVASSPDWGVTQSEPIEVAGVKIRRAITDTTLTMWRAGERCPGRLSTSDWQQEQYRMDAPYLVKHVPWYADSARPTAESLFYRNAPDRKIGPVFGM